MSRTSDGSSSSVGTLTTSDSNDTAGSYIKKPLDAKSNKQAKESGLDFKVQSAANSNRIQKTIKLIDPTNEDAVWHYRLHIHEINVLSLIDEYKKKPELIMDSRYKDFQPERLFSNLPTGNICTINDETNTIVIDQQRFNGMRLYDFIQKPQCEIVISLLLLMIYIEIHKLSIMGIVHNDLHAHNIFVVETSSMDRLLHHEDWSVFTKRIVSSIINKVAKNDTSTNQFIAWLDKLLVKLPFRIKIFDFDRAVLHGRNMNDPSYIDIVPLLKICKLYTLSIQRLITSNDLHQSTIDLIYQLYHSKRLHFHDSLEYIKEVIYDSEHKDAYIHDKHSGSVFQKSTHEDELTPFSCILYEIKTLKEAWNKTKDTPSSSVWPFIPLPKQPKPHPIPNVTDLITSERLSPHIQSVTSSRVGPSRQVTPHIQSVTSSRVGPSRQVSPIPPPKQVGPSRQVTPKQLGAETPIVKTPKRLIGNKRSMRPDDEIPVSIKAGKREA